MANHRLDNTPKAPLPLPGQPTGRSRFALASTTGVLLAVVLLTTPIIWMRADLNAAPYQNASAPASPEQEARATVDKYCVGCHNNRTRIGGLSLEIGMDDLAAHGETWEKVILKLRSGTMPPAGSPRPDRVTYDRLAGWLETTIDRTAPGYAGRPLLHRLNRAEYANTIRDLLDLEIDAAALLPPDDSAYGFDNVAEVLNVSPALQERYLSAAMKVAALAVGDPNQLPTSQTWNIPQDLSQNRHVEGLPLGTVGGTRQRYNFPLDGTYELRATLYRTNLNILRGLQTRQRVEFSVDGERVKLVEIGGAKDLADMFEAPTDTSEAVDARLRVRVPIKAGPHDIAVTFLSDAQYAEPVRLQPFVRSSVDNFDWAGHPHLQTLTVQGPFDVTGSGDTPSRRRIFSCHPADKATRAQEDACAQGILWRLLPLAYRRPLSDPELEADFGRVMAFYETGRNQGGSDRAFERGIQAALERMLASPKFVFRAEPTPLGIAPGSIYPVSDVELASRLSFFLWSSIPDQELLDLAGQGRLSDPAVLDAEARRMLADPKAEALTQNFAGQWLQLRNLRNFQPNTNIFPNFDDNLRQGFRKETELLFESVLHENRSVLDLLTADYTFVDERLAQHYGIPNIFGSRFRRVPVPDEARRGLLGQGSILALTSKAERTSPVVRGKWILENLLGLTVPPPPPNVPPLAAQAAGEKPKTMREQMALHRANPVCAACHKTLDPIGFVMENFNAVGAWRDDDQGNPIDATAELPDGTQVNGVVEYREALLDRKALFIEAVTKKLLTYALGRGLDYRDMPEVRRIMRNTAPGNYKLSDLILEVIRSTPFRNNTAAPDPGG